MLFVHCACHDSPRCCGRYDDGYRDVVNIDFSPVVVREMLGKHLRARPAMRWQVRVPPCRCGSEGSADRLNCWHCCLRADVHMHVKLRQIVSVRQQPSASNRSGTQVYRRVHAGVRSKIVPKTPVASRPHNKG